MRGHSSRPTEENEFSSDDLTEGTARFAGACSNEADEPGGDGVLMGLPGPTEVSLTSTPASFKHY